MRKWLSYKNTFGTRDPYVLKYNHKYYRCYTEDSASVSVACADTIDELANASGKKVYLPEKDHAYSKELWAPELHILDGKCYIYVACDDGDNHHHRMYVLENHSADPMKPYVMHGKIADRTDKWAIDGTVVRIRGKNYFVWSGWDGDENVCQNLYIAEMKNPFELATERYLISKPEYDWEKLGSSGQPESPFINEGAFGFCMDGEYYLTYSAAGSWCKDYCIALLKLVGKNPLDYRCWNKCSMPVLSANDRIQGAGHCSVVCEENQATVFFHAWDKEETEIQWNTVNVWQADLRKNEGKIIIE